MERRDEEPPVAREHRMAVEFGEHVDPGSDLLDPRRPDEHGAQPLGQAVDVEIRLERRRLAAERVPAHADIHEAEMVAVEHDHPRARAEHRPIELRDRRVEAVDPHQVHECGRFAARDHEPVEPCELLGLAHLDRLDAEPRKHLHVLAEVPLHGKDADPKRFHG